MLTSCCFKISRIRDTIEYPVSFSAPIGLYLAIFKLLSMKKILLTVGAFTAFTASAQTFSDNFDSYTAGQPMAQQSAGAWTTWSGTVGGAEDVLVSNADAVSGSNSIFLSTTAQTGGPTDLVKNFGVLNTGQF